MNRVRLQAARRKKRIEGRRDASPGGNNNPLAYRLSRAIERRLPAQSRARRVHRAAEIRKSGARGPPAEREKRKAARGRGPADEIRFTTDRIRLYPGARQRSRAAPSLRG